MSNKRVVKKIKNKFFEFPDNKNKFISQMLHNPFLTLLFVRLFPTLCFDNDFAVVLFFRHHIPTNGVAPLSTFTVANLRFQPSC